MDIIISQYTFVPLFSVIPLCVSISLLTKGKKITTSEKEKIIVLDIFSIIFALISSYYAIAYNVITY